MDPFTKSDLQELLDHPSQPHLSLYMPAERAGAEIQQNPIRFKNLLRQAEDRLIEHGLRRPEAESLLLRARDELMMDETFWQFQSSGLAVFVSPELFVHFRLPIDFDEIVHVGEQFHLKPLFSLFQKEGRFYVLALSQGSVRLLEGWKYGVQEVDLGETPTSLEEALKYDDPEKQMQGHATTAGGGAGGQGAGQGRPVQSYHGQREDEDDDRSRIRRFFQHVDKGVSEILGDDRAPLVLAGVEYLLPIYREVSSYPGLIEAGIPGNPTGVRDEDLHVLAWELLEPVFEQEHENAADLFRREAGKQTGKASSDIEEVVQAAYGGRVGQLFISEDCEIWGNYDLEANRVEIHPERRPDSEDLLNTAALYTFINNGSVYLLAEDQTPDQNCLAAVFRY
jgi:hypothetical protein